MFFRTAGEELQHLVHVEKVERFKVGHTKFKTECRVTRRAIIPTGFIREIMAELGQIREAELSLSESSKR